MPILQEWSNISILKCERLQSFCQKTQNGGSHFGFQVHIAPELDMLLACIIYQMLQKYLSYNIVHICEY